MKEIPVSGPSGQGKVILVDDDVFEWASKFKWYLHGRKKNYVYRMDNRRPILMHQEVMPGHRMIDHEDRNGLNNQRSNLRPCTNQQNGANMRPRGGKSRHKGVTYSNRPNNRNRPWRSYIKVGYKQISLGYHPTEAEAALAYNVAAVEHFGEFALLNVV